MSLFSVLNTPITIGRLSYMMIEGWFGLYTHTRWHAIVADRTGLCMPSADYTLRESYDTKWPLYPLPILMLIFYNNHGITYMLYTLLLTVQSTSYHTIYLNTLSPTPEDGNVLGNELEVLLALSFSLLTKSNAFCCVSVPCLNATFFHVSSSSSFILSNWASISFPTPVDHTLAILLCTDRYKYLLLHHIDIAKCNIKRWYNIPNFANSKTLAFIPTP